MLNAEYPVMKIDVSKQELREVAKAVGVDKFPWVLIYHEEHEVANAKPDYSTADQIEGKLLQTVMQMNREKAILGDYGHLNVQPNPQSAPKVNKETVIQDKSIKKEVDIRSYIDQVKKNPQNEASKKPVDIRPYIKEEKSSKELERSQRIDVDLRHFDENVNETQIDINPVKSQRFNIDQKDSKSFKVQKDNHGGPRNRQWSR